MEAEKTTQNISGGQRHPGPGVAIPEVLLRSERVQEGAVVALHQRPLRRSKANLPSDVPRGGERQMVPVVGPSPARLQPARGLGARRYLGCCFFCPFRSDFIGQAWT